MEQKTTAPALPSEEGTCCQSESCCAPKSPYLRQIPKVGRNDPCPCGNGKKFKKCCGRSA
ncbi:MAG: zinc chelation protein SecC [Gammaproteobacteria bacterium]|nr:zinc chelation protein SecC [Gammaproteobacteria bacterium]